MTGRRIAIGALVLALLGAAGWFCWRQLFTAARNDGPQIPEVSLTDAKPGLAEKVEAAIREVRRQPKSADAWGALGMVLDVNGFSQQARVCYERAQELDANNPSWPYFQALMTLAMTTPAEALPLLRQALRVSQLNEDRATILFSLIRVLVDEGHLAEAETYLQDLREIDGEDVRVRFGLGLLAVARDDKAAARRHLGALTDSPIARRRACLLLASLAEDREMARTFQERATRLPPDDDWPDPFQTERDRHKVDRMERITLFWELDRQGRHEESLAFMRRVVAESPDTMVCYILGFTLHARGMYEEAEVQLRASLRFNPKYIKAHVLLAACLLAHGEKIWKDGNKERARELFRQSVAAADQLLAWQRDGPTHLTRGRALKYLERNEEAISAFRQAVLLQPEGADNHLYLGEALAEAGEVREGLESLQNAVKLARPDDPKPRQTLEKWQKRQ